MSDSSAPAKAGSTGSSGPKPLEGNALMFGGLMLALTNFIVVLDMTIANVSVSHIAGGLAISPNEGTYVITSYAVAEAIIVPLSGWLAKRFGTLRVFYTCVALFGLFSLLCGLSENLGMLIFGRICQGLVGGPIMPLSQTLLLQVFPAQKRGTALTLWSMTTLIAPALGPIIGGYIDDNWGWPYIFLINIPIAITAALVIMNLLKSFETPKVKAPVDFIGMGLLILWVSSLQIMLDKGKDWDWFSSNLTWALLIIAVIGFACFMIWELTEEHPIVDLRVFRHRGYSAAVLTISLAFGAYFASNVLTPLWLQNYMGYTATWSGMTTAAVGISAVFAAPFAAKLSQKVDPRYLVCIGVTWIGLATFVRSFGTTDISYGQIALPMLVQGFGMPFFFVPLTGLALSSVKPNETASAAGLMNFLRTLSGAVATSIVTTSWENTTAMYHADAVGRLASPLQLATTLGDTSAAGQTVAGGILNNLLQNQTIMMATNHIFLIASFTFAFAATAIWLAPRPKRKADTSAAH